MIIDYRGGLVPNVPHKLFDADGRELFAVGSMSAKIRKPVVINTETGECQCNVYCYGCGKPIETFEGGEILKDTITLKPPLKVVDCLGNEVSCATV